MPSQEEVAGLVENLNEFVLRWTSRTNRGVRLQREFSQGVIIPEPVGSKPGEVGGHGVAIHCAEVDEPRDTSFLKQPVFSSDILQARLRTQGDPGDTLKKHRDPMRLGSRKGQPVLSERDGLVGRVIVDGVLECQEVAVEPSVDFHESRRDAWADFFPGVLGKLAVEPREGFKHEPNLGGNDRLRRRGRPWHPGLHFPEMSQEFKEGRAVGGWNRKWNERKRGGSSDPVVIALESREGRSGRGPAFENQSAESRLISPKPSAAEPAGVSQVLWLVVRLSQEWVVFQDISDNGRLHPDPFPIDQAARAIRRR